jgi:murein DD-endopeptidase MepM/ murein hydrolase activator NlpD
VRRLAPLAIALGFALLVGSARADTFAVVPTPAGASYGLAVSPLALPSSTTPNVEGSLAVASLTTPPASPAQLSYSQLLGVWQRAGTAYGIPWQVLAAINKIESNFGRNMGPSSAGAVGWMQFMPDTWLRWGTDADGDGVADPWNPTDGVFSAARYLAAAGGSADLYRAVYAYNHADWYVRQVLDLANLYGGDSTLALSLDRLQQGLDSARRTVAAAGERLQAAERVVQRQERIALRWQSRAAQAQLLSDRLALEEKAGLAFQRRAAAQARVDRLSATLTEAQQQLAQAQQESAAASFAPAASQLLASPSYSGSYVFPVGGGPGSVSASHTHHDYPAVDIAAPEGSPLYALAAGTVLRAWSVPDARCGIGFTFRAFDGQVWTYCHLSVIEPTVSSGAPLAAGQQVGLVGSTGHATGPHLHLQLQPAGSWPQQQSWFAGFAGTAFTWSDAGANDAVRSLAAVGTPGPVFQVVPAAAPVVAQVDAQVDGPVDGVVYFSSTSS